MSPWVGTELGTVIRRDAPCRRLGRAGQISLRATSDTSGVYKPPGGGGTSSQSSSQCPTHAIPAESTNAVTSSSSSAAEIPGVNVRTARSRMLIIDFTAFFLLARKSHLNKTI